MKHHEEHDPASNLPEELRELGERDERHERLCAYVFGELPEGERAALAAELARDPELAAEHARLAATVDVVREALPPTELSPAIRATLAAAAEARAKRARFRFLRGGGGALRAAAALVILLGGAFLLRDRFLGEGAEGTRLGDSVRQIARLEGADDAQPAGAAREERERKEASRADADRLAEVGALRDGPVEAPAVDEAVLDRLRALGYTESVAGAQPAAPSSSPARRGLEKGRAPSGEAAPELGAALASRASNAPEREERARAKDERDSLGVVLEDAEPSQETFHDVIGVGGGSGGAYGGKASARAQEPGPAAGADGFFLGGGRNPAAPGAAAGSGPDVRDSSTSVALSRVAPFLATVQSASGVGPESDLDARLRALAGSPPFEMDRELAARTGYHWRTTEPTRLESEGAPRDLSAAELQQLEALGYSGGGGGGPAEEAEDEPPLSREALAAWTDELLDGTRVRPGETPRAMFFRWWGDHPFVRTADDPLSTFSVDVDTASYTLARRYLTDGRLPPREAVRTEELVNRFRADRPAPEGATFAIGLESAPSPFHPDPRVELLRVTLRGKDVADFERQPLALTFVVDVSGSMKDGGRLFMVQEALNLLSRQLAPSDSIALVTFSREAKLVLPPTSAARRSAFEDAIDALRGNGGTNVEAGLRLGFETAADALTPGAVNRVVLLSDGVGNLGETDRAALLAAVEEYRAKGLYLNTIGVGMGNHDDAFLEQLADRGDGLCQYIDSYEEAERALVDDFTKTLQPIARDVKIQVELDPAQVARYRQLGYENRVVADEDFRNDAVDAGEVNAGHQVTALYELELTGSAGSGGPLATVRVRYKPPFAVDAGDASEAAAAEAEVAAEIERSLEPGDRAPSFAGASFGYRRAAVAAQLAEVLRRSVHARDDSLAALVETAKGLAAERDDPDTVELAELVEAAAPLVEAEREQESDELVELLDRLSRMRYEQGLREQLGEALEPEAAAAFEKELAALEARVRLLAAERAGMPVEDVNVDLLRALGYIDGER